MSEHRQQRAIGILGMHRSGTSAIARALNLLGVSVGPLEKMLPPQDDNPEGFWEHQEIFALHERLLKTFGSSWDHPRPLPEHWWQREEVIPYRQELRALIQREFADTPLWLWKDPRTSLLLPLWTEVLQQLGVDVAYVICLRHPLDVAASLNRRDCFSQEKSLALWQYYTVSAAYWTQNTRRVVVSYDRLLDDWESSLTRLANILAVEWPSPVEAQRVTLSTFLRRDLRHSRSELAELSTHGTVGEIVARTYSMLLETETAPRQLQSEDFASSITRVYREYCAYAAMLGGDILLDSRDYTRHPTLEVFGLVNGEFSQDAAIAAPLFFDGEEHSYECPLSFLSGGILRLDPVNFPAVVEIRSIELSLRGSASLTPTVLHSWGPGNGFRDIVAGPDLTLLSDPSQGLLCVSSGGDPQLFLYNVPDVECRDSGVIAVLRVVMKVKNVFAKPLAETLIRWRDVQQHAAAANVQAALEMKDCRIGDLEQTLQEQNVTINELRQTTQEQNVTINELRQTTQEQNVTINELRQTTAELKAQHHQQQREVELLHEQTMTLTRQYQEESRLRALMLSSLSWHITAPLRKLRGWLSYLWRIFRWPRVYRIQVKPNEGIETVGQWFQSVGDDPQFFLHPEHGRMPRGWVVLSYQTTALQRWLHPSLYIDTGAGFIETQKLSLRRPFAVRTLGTTPSVFQGASTEAETLTEVQFIVFLAGPVRGLRLDFFSSPTQFLLRNVTVRELGTAQVGAMLLWRHVRPLLTQPRQLLYTVQRNFEALREEDPGTIRRRFLLQDQTTRASYEEWIEAYDTLVDSDRRAIRRHIEKLVQKPLISVIMPTYNTPEQWLRKAIESIRVQLYPHWELCIADDASVTPHVKAVLEHYQAADPRIKVVYREQNGHISAASNSALALATGEFIALLDHDDELPEHALYMVAVELNHQPEANLLYSDEDKIDEQGNRYWPYFKPDWNPDLFLCQNFVSHLGVYRTHLVREVGGFREGYEGSQDWDLALRIVERIPSTQIRHLPHILYHWRAISGSTALTIEQKNYAQEAQHKLLISHFERVGKPAEILPAVGSHWRIKYPIPQPLPLVTLIIPTRNRFDLLSRCVESIYEKTTYRHFELLIVDNQSDEPETLTYLQRLTQERGVRVLRYDAPFNYSAINNFAVRQARGELVGLLNNDLEVISPGWLEEMVSQALRPEIGAVGALLYYPNDTIQHAGVIVGLLGVAGHSYTNKPRGYGGQTGRALLVQNLAAVTAACLLMRRQLFEEIGGLDEKNLVIAFNDVDMCLRLLEKGYWNLWTPYAELYHHESASRGYEDSLEKQLRFKREIAYMQWRWKQQLRHDPSHNPNLSLDQGDFSLAFPPRARKPWL